MATKRAIDNNELKNRFDHFHHEARHEDKPYRLLGKPQVTKKQVNVLFAYPPDADKAAFAEMVSEQLKAYGLEPLKVTTQKLAVRVLAGLLVTPSETETKENAE
ncbi:MAG: hypothetical protein H6672_21405 [Anaerolineaceae bacterium]|nr:hypothetical protein [Anaerolineaceae bacterium]